MVRILLIYADLLLALGVNIAIGTLFSIGVPAAILMLLLMTLAGTIYVGVTASLAIVQLIFARWWLALASVSKAAAFVALLLPCIAAGDYVHLAIFYPFYRWQIETHGDNAQLRFDWGDKAVWVTDGLQADTLVYDPTDALGRVVDETRDASQPGLGLATRHLLGRFYIEREFSR